MFIHSKLLTNIFSPISKSVIIFSIFTFVVLNFSAQAKILDKNLIERDFMRVMMSAEFGGKSRLGRSVKKYEATVRFAIINHAAKNRQKAVRSFIWELPKKIKGLQTSVVSNPAQANFRIHVVDQHQYADVIRNEIYKNPKAAVRGACFAHVVASMDGIKKTDVVIVSNRKEKLFQRCLVEEVLQGLGPLADRGHKDYSIFNTASKHHRFTTHDQILLNALYDPRIKAGMSKSQVKQVLPEVIRDCIARIHF